MYNPDPAYNPSYPSPAYDPNYPPPYANPGSVPAVPQGYVAYPAGYPTTQPITVPAGYYQPSPYPNATSASVPPAYSTSPTDTGFRPTTVDQPPVATNSENVESNFGSSFSDKAIRRAFIRKVYLILLAQLLVTFGIVAIFVFVDGVKSYVHRAPGFYWASYAVFFVTYITLACCSNLRRQFPANIIILSLFTLSLSYMVATISSYYDTNVVLLAAGICAGVCLGITVLSIWSKFDITGCIGVICIFGLVVFFFGIATIFTYNYIMNTVYAALFGLLMMLFLAYDTQVIMGGRRYELSPEEYIFGALCLYVDIVYIFLILLMLLGGRSK